MDLRARRQALKPIETSSTATVNGGEAVVKREEDGEPLSPAGRLFHAPRFNCCIVAVMGCKSVLRPEVIRAGLKLTLLKHSRFSSKLLRENGGKMKWIATTVNLEDHVIVPDLDPNADSHSSPDELVGDYISGITETPLDHSRPLWEVHLLNIKTSDAESVAVFRIHHSLGDGASLISLLLACTRKSSDPEALPDVPGSNRVLATSRSRSGGIIGGLSAIWSALRLIWNTFVDLMLFCATILFLEDSKTPVKGGPGVEIKTKRFVHRTVSLDEIKLVKRATNTTINDVLLGVTQAGLSLYLNRRYGKDEVEGEANQKRNNLPKNIRLRSTILVNVRPTAGIQDLADMMAEKSKAKWGNRIGYIILPFTIALQDDPLDYVRKAKAMVDRKKLSLEAICSYSSAILILKSFGVQVAGALSHRVLCNTTLAFSNIIGPSDEISFFGHPMAYLAPSVYGHPHALTFHCQSYANKMTISVAVDPDVIPDPYQLCDDLEESLELIKNAAVKELTGDTAHPPAGEN